MLEAETPKSEKPAAARRATPARRAARKAGKAPPRSRSRAAVEGVMTAARNGDLPAALFLVALADDGAFEEIRRRAVSLLLEARAAGGATSGAAVTLANAVALSRRLQNRRPV